MNLRRVIYTLFGDTDTTVPVNLSAMVRNNQPYTERELIEMESKIGARLFGTIPDGHRREFFCLDNNSWIWYEEWRENGYTHKTTVRYEIQAAGVLKVQEGARYSYLEGTELDNFIQAVKAYHDTVLPVLYHKNPAVA